MLCNVFENRWSFKSDSFLRLVSSETRSTADRTAIQKTQQIIQSESKCRVAYMRRYKKIVIDRRMQFYISNEFTYSNR